MQDRYHHDTVAHVFCRRAPIRIYSERVGFRHVIGGLVQCYRIDYRRLEQNVLTFALDGQVVSLSQQAYEPVVQKNVSLQNGMSRFEYLSLQEFFELSDYIRTQVYDTSLDQASESSGMSMH